MYADDTVLYVSHKNPQRCIKGCQILLNRLHEWCTSNKLTINTSKTKHMFVSPRQNQVEIVMSLNNDTLTNVKSCRYLGIDIDYSLSFDAMEDNMYNKANQKFYLT